MARFETDFDQVKLSDANSESVEVQFHVKSALMASSDFMVQEIFLRERSLSLGIKKMVHCT